MAASTDGMAEVELAEVNLSRPLPPSLALRQSITSARVSVQVLLSGVCRAWASLASAGGLP